MAGILEHVEEIVLAVKEKDKTVALFEELFGLEFDRSWTVPVDSMNVKCAMVGDTQFHVVTSTSPDTLIDKFIQQRGEGIHHIVYWAEDMINNTSPVVTKILYVDDSSPLSRKQFEGPHHINATGSEWITSRTLISIDATDLPAGLHASGIATIWYQIWLWTNQDWVLLQDTTLYWAQTGNTGTGPFTVTGEDKYKLI